MGCVMAAGPDWIEVSVPPMLRIEGGASLRFPPSLKRYPVTPSWRTEDRAGFTFLDDRVPEEQLKRLASVLDPRPASERQPDPKLQPSQVTSPTQKRGHRQSMGGDTHSTS